MTREDAPGSSSPSQGGGDTTPRRRKRLKRSSGLKRAPDRYGPLFEAVKRLDCWLRVMRYSGAGHPQCWIGVQGGHTAHHVGHKDADGLIPGCGAAHDLYAGLGSALTQEAFHAWLDSKGLTLDEVAQSFVREVANDEDFPPVRYGRALP